MQGLAGLMNRHHERMGGCGGSALLRRYHRYSTSAVHVLDQQVTIPLIGLVRTPLLWLQDLWR